MMTKGESLFQAAEELYCDKKYSEALPVYLSAMEEGHGEAAYKVGFMYYLGDGVSMSDETAFGYFKKASELGYKMANGYLALLYIESHLGEYSDSELYAMLKEGFDEGSRRCCYYLAHGHYYGEYGAKENGRLCAYFAIEGVKANFELNYYFLGELYYNGEFLPTNYAFAKYCFDQVRDTGIYNTVIEKYEKENELFQRIAPVEPTFPTFDDDAPDFFDRSCPFKLHCEAIRCILGLSRERDVPLGRKYLEEAVAGGNGNSYFAYGVRLVGDDFEGEYTITDDFVRFQPDGKKALELFEKGVAVGSSDCAYSLGQIYFNGDMWYRENLVKAVKYFKLAVAWADDAEAKSLLAAIGKVEEKHPITRTCPLCRRECSLILNEREFSEYTVAEANDDLPDGVAGLDLFEKEFLITGMCPLCQERVFGKGLPTLVTRWKWNG